MNKTAIENAIKNKEISNFTFTRAFECLEHSGNEKLDFNDVIWDYDIDEIISLCKEYGISVFTVSSNFSGLIPTLAKFTDLGCTMTGLTNVNATYRDIITGKQMLIPAITIKVA